MERPTKKCTVLHPFFATLLILALSTTISAAEPGSQEDDRAKIIEEVLVTAEKRSESILEVPLTMTAFDETLLSELGITSENDLEVLVPGLQFGDSGEGVGQGTVIRGIGSRLAGETHSDLAVATYIDGVYTLGTYGVAPAFFDLERVEVARGPQGTLNGRNSIAGSISYYTKKSTDEWDFVALTEFTDQFTQRYNVAGGGPITENIAFRISAGYYEGDGAQENKGLGGDYDAPDQISYSPQLRFNNDRWDVNFRWAHVEDKGSPRTQISITNPDRTNPCIDGAPEPCGGNFNRFYLNQTPNPSIGADCPPGTPGFRCGNLDNELAVNATGVQDSEADQYFLSVTFDLNNALTLRYNFGDSDVFRQSSRDRDGTNRVASASDRTIASDAPVPLENTRVGVDYDYTETSHELQLVSNLDGKFNFITGLFYYENDTTWSVPRDDFNSAFRFLDADVAAQSAGYDDCQDFLTSFVSTFANTDPNNFPAAGTLWTCAPGLDHTQTLYFTTNGKSETQAFFVNADYQFNDEWLVSGGLRYTEDEKNQGQNGGDTTFGFIGVPILLFFDETDEQTRTWDQTIGHISIEYTPRGQLLYYGRVSTGYRAGGFNTFVAGAPSDPIEEETLINYEFGIKGLFLEQRLQLSAAVFLNDYEGMQLNAIQVRPAGSPPLPTDNTPLVEFTSNIPGGELWGGEVEFIYQATDNWRFSGYYQYLDSEIGRHISVIRGNPNSVFETYTYTDATTGLPTTSQFESATDQTGNRLPQQPKHKLALTAVYERELPIGDLQLLAAYSHTGARDADIGNLSFYKMPSYDRWDVRAAWNLPEKNLSATLFIQNVADEIGLIEFIPLSTNAALPSAATMTNHRQVGLQLTWRLNN